MSVVGLKESEKIAKSLQSKIKSSLIKQRKEIETEISKIEFLLNDRDALRAWKVSQADNTKMASLFAQLDEIERLYLEAGDTNAGKIFKERMAKELKRKLTNLQANRAEVAIRAQKLKAQTQNKILTDFTKVRQEGATRELYLESRNAGGFLSKIGKAYMQDLATLETKAAGSKTLGKYMSNLYNTYEQGLKDVFVSGIVRGDSYNKMINNLMKKTDITVGKANILVRTEANAIFNDSVKNVIQTNPLVKGYRFRAVLDSKTSKICQEHDGEFISKDDIQPGVNYPPLHPNCRSTVTTVLVSENEKEDTVQRYTKNKSNEWTEVPLGMTYKEFKSQMANLQNPYRKVPTTATYTKFDIDKLDSTLRSAEGRVVNSPVEKAIILSKYGDRIELTGTATHVDTEGVGLDLMKDAILTHNHPGMVQGPSKDDLKEMLRTGVKELRTVDTTFVYSIKPTDQKPTELQLANAYREAELQAMEKLMTEQEHYLEGEVGYQRLAMQMLANNHPEWYQFSYKKHNFKRTV